MNTLVRYLALGLLLSGLACTSHDVSYKDGVQKALEQADLKDVSVSEDKDRNTITLGGTLHSDMAKARAGEVAKSAAGNRIIANEISVQPVGMEAQAKDVASDLDAAIEKNYEAAIISHRLDKQHIDAKAKNGVLTLSGSVQTTAQRQLAQKIGGSIPNVQQVVNQIEVKR